MTLFAFRECPFCHARPMDCDEDSTHGFLYTCNACHTVWHLNSDMMMTTTVTDASGTREVHPPKAKPRKAAAILHPTSKYRSRRAP